MAAGEHGHKRLLDHPLLSENDVADRRLGVRDLRRRRFRLAHDCVVEPFDHFTAGYRHDIRSLSRLAIIGLPSGPPIGPSCLTKKRATFGPTIASRGGPRSPNPANCLEITLFF